MAELIQLSEHVAALVDDDAQSVELFESDD